MKLRASYILTMPPAADEPATAKTSASGEKAARGLEPAMAASARVSSEATAPPDSLSAVALAALFCRTKHTRSKGVSKGQRRAERLFAVVVSRSVARGTQAPCPDWRGPTARRGRPRRTICGRPRFSGAPYAPQTSSHERERARERERERESSLVPKPSTRAARRQEAVVRRAHRELRARESSRDMCGLWNEASETNGLD